MLPPSPAPRNMQSLSVQTWLVWNSLWRSDWLWAQRRWEGGTLFCFMSAGIKVVNCHICPEHQELWNIRDLELKSWTQNEGNQKCESRVFPVSIDQILQLWGTSKVASTIPYYTRGGGADTALYWWRSRKSVARAERKLFLTIWKLLSLLRMKRTLLPTHPPWAAGGKVKQSSSSLSSFV